MELAGTRERAAGTEAHSARHAGAEGNRRRLPGESRQAKPAQKEFEDKVRLETQLSQVKIKEAQAEAAAALGGAAFTVGDLGTR
jgi:hypothetical protein